jgi:hypothetical protein
MMFAYKTNKTEKHPNPVGDGSNTVQYFKENFAFTGRESGAILAAHTFGDLTSGKAYFPTRGLQALQTFSTMITTRV